MDKKSKTDKERADKLLVSQGIAENRSKAQAFIMSGKVYDGTKKIDKPGIMIPVDHILTFKGQKMPYVSRGGLKLKGALDAWGIENVKNLICVDIGASTGGFTDCLLQAGAKKVYAIDVGYGQLAWKVREDDRVVVMERVNFRTMDLSLIQDSIDLIVIDVSFISIKKLLKNIIVLLEKKKGTLICLFKPQFEVGREAVGKGGIVRDEKIREKALNEMEETLKENGFSVRLSLLSPIRGQEGNQEYLIVSDYSRL